MIRSSRTRFAFRWLVLFAVVAGTFGVVGQEARAQKGKPAVPAGLIYFKMYPNTTDSVKADGSGLTRVLPVTAMNLLEDGFRNYAVPCNHLYGGDRWYIATAVTGYYDSVVRLSGNTTTDYPHRDLVAVRKRPGSETEIDIVQLTDFYGIVNLFPESACVSNDSNEDASSFVGAWGHDIRGSFVEDPDGATSYDDRETIVITLRLPLRVSDFLAPEFVPIGGTVTDEDIDAVLWPTISTASLNKQGTTSPDGNFSIAVRGTSDASAARLMIVDAAAPNYDNPVVLLWDGSVASPTGIGNPQWSPDGSTIAFGGDSSSIWTIPAGGGDPSKIMASATVTTTTKNKGVTTTTTTTYKYTRPIWSPDSQHVVAVRNGYSSTNEVVSTDLVRVPAAGGTIVKITPVSLGSLGPALRWVPSN